MGRETPTARLFSISGQITDNAIYSQLQSHTINIFPHLIVGGPKHARMPAQLPKLNLTYWLVGLHTGEWQHHHTGCLSRSWYKWLGERSGKKRLMGRKKGPVQAGSIRFHSTVTQWSQIAKNSTKVLFGTDFLSISGLEQ